MTSPRLMVLAALAMLLPSCGDDSKSNPKRDSQVATTDGQKGDGSSSGDTAYDINKGIIKDGAKVNLKELVVTGITNKSGKFYIYAQELNGGEYSGANLYNPTRSDGALADLKAGDHISVTNGTVQWFALTSSPFPNGKKLIEIGTASISKLPVVGAQPATPKEITAAEAIKEDSNLQSPWTHVLVKIKDLPVGCFNLQYSDLSLGAISAGQDLYAFTPPAYGDCKTFTGVLGYWYDYYIWPRSDDDITAGTGCATVNTLGIKADIRGSNKPAAKTPVKITGAVVTAISSSGTTSGTSTKYTGFFVEEPTGGTKSGIYVYYTWSSDKTPAAGQPVVGDKIDLNGVYDDYKSSSSSSSNTVAEITDACFTKNGTATVPAPEVVADPATIATNGSAVKDYEGVLLQVNNVTVGETITSGTKKVGFKLQTSNLIVDTMLYDFMSNNAPTGTYASITGVLHYFSDQYRLLPRSAGDFVK